jgi:hypothetical protein
MKLKQIELSMKYDQIEQPIGQKMKETIGQKLQLDDHEDLCHDLHPEDEHLMKEDHGGYYQLQHYQQLGLIEQEFQLLGLIEQEFQLLGQWQNRLVHKNHPMLQDYSHDLNQEIHQNRFQ